MWIYKGQEFKETDIGNSIGFVYIITNLTNNRKYVGKKLFTFGKTKQVKLKKKKIRVKSDWETYYGSNLELISDVSSLGESNFTREILYLCPTKGTCNYWESYEIMNRHAIISENFYNQWIHVKVSASQIKPL